MKAKVLRIKEEIQSGNVKFLDITSNIMQKNSIIYSDNYGEMDEKTTKEVSKLVPFLELLYYGSKHSINEVCEQGFTRVIEHNGILIKLTYYAGPETFVSAERVDKVPCNQKLVTVDLLRERFKEEEQLKSDLRPIIDKYIDAGLTFEEITKCFVDIMRRKN